MSVFIVIADPEPSNGIGIKDANSAVAERDSDRPRVFFLIDALEMKRLMKWVLGPQPISCLGATSDTLVQRPIRGPNEGSVAEFIIAQGLTALPDHRQSPLGMLAPSSIRTIQIVAKLTF